jgi:peptidyl-prolyl cis-trans isomerase A (cyclophilin A)
MALKLCHLSQPRTGVVPLKNSMCSLILGITAWLTVSLADAATPANPQVSIKTEKGDILVELFSKAAPISVDNFIKNVNSYHYDGLIFHRVIKNFMVQTGGFTFDLTSRPSEHDPIINEGNNGLKNKRGTLAMARTSDPNSAMAQFFINHKTNRFLDASDNKAGYAVFGKVVTGMAVVDSIAGVETTTKKGYQNVPIKPIRILSARLVNPSVWTPLPEAKPEANVLSFERPVPVK